MTEQSKVKAMNIKKQPDQIYTEYEAIQSYKSTLNLFETVKVNENFYLGDQWNGVNAPNIEKPVINILRQGIDYYVSNTVSDDISVQVVVPEDLAEDTKKAFEQVVSDEIDRILEDIKFKSKQREFIKNCSVDGDACNYFWNDTSKANEKYKYGRPNHELIDNTNIGFGDPTQPDEQKQPYIIIVQKLPVDEVKDMAKEAGSDPDEVKADVETFNDSEAYAQAQNNYVTVITKLWRENKTIHAIKCTKDVVLKKEVDLKIKLYPISYMSWRKRKNSYHGESPLKSVIPNQIMVNKYYMMQHEFLKKTAFPKLLYDSTKIQNWSNKVEAIGVTGDPREAVFSSTPTLPMNAQASQYLQDLIDKTKESMGIYDVALGNARPENTSAIIALQKTAQQPLELQKLDYYQMIENSIRVLLDLMSANYGVMNVTIEQSLSPEEMMAIQQQREIMVAQQSDPMNPQTVAPQQDESSSIQMTIPFDFAQVAPDKLSLTIEVGASQYWSEIMQIQTLDNMKNRNMIDDITYIEQMPNGILKSKKDIIDAMKKKQAQDAQMAMQQAMQGLPQ
jgi:hypothetical protein